MNIMDEYHWMVLNLWINEYKGWILLYGSKLVN